MLNLGLQKNSLNIGVTVSELMVMVVKYLDFVVIF